MDREDIREIIEAVIGVLSLAIIVFTLFVVGC